MTRRPSALIAVAWALLAGCAADVPPSGAAQPATTAPSRPRPAAGLQVGAEGVLGGACRASGARVEIAASGEVLARVGSQVVSTAASSAITVRRRGSMADARSGVPGGADVAEFGPEAVDEYRRAGVLSGDDLDGRVVDEGIPAGLVDASAGWVAPWVSIVAFLVTGPAANAPTTFAALAADRTLTVGIDGDPRDSAGARAAVVAAAVASGGSPADAVPGIDWFARLAAQRRLVAESPDVLIDLGDRAVARRDELAAQGIAATLVYPEDALVARPTMVGVLRDAPRPACATWWVRHLLSAEVAGTVARAGLLPAQWASAEALGRVPFGDRRSLPSPVALRRLVVLTADGEALAGEAIRDAWADRVGRSR